ncbi:MAG: adenylosuccinate lyase [Chloroflexi bacterium]|nr:adenylosuccinate lyase [Chloroflexota bacterium]MBV9602074.1 adenylosuccinate lyase [Chloroflexota bacterium]
MIPRYTRPAMGGVWSDEHRAELWLKVELAVCEAWTAMGVIPEEDMAAIRGASIQTDRSAELFRQTHHDMIAFTRAIAEHLGPPGRWIHLGLTSSDVLDTALSLQIQEAADILAEDLRQLEAVLSELAVRFKHTLMIGRTHGVHAEPTTFGHKLAVFVAQVRRDCRRLELARDELRVGKISGAVGTHANVPAEIEERTMALLGLAPAEASTQILQRDRHAQFVCTLAVIAATLEQQATEIRALQRTEIGEAFEPFSSGQQGSSAMPHKRNPELCERLCGMARLLRGHAMTALDNVAVWHERDISHSSAERLILPDACIALDYMLDLLRSIYDGLDVAPDAMKRNLGMTHGLIYSGQVLLALVESGMSRGEAYDIVQAAARRVWAGDGDLLTHLSSDPRVGERLTAEELQALFDPSYHLRGIEVPFARLGLI